MRSDNLKRHQKACQDVKCYTSFSSKANAGQKKRTLISVSEKDDPEEIDDWFSNSHQQQNVIPNEEIKECYTADVDDPLTESEQKGLRERFKSLHYDLIHKGLRKNATELLDILDILLEADLISEADRIETGNKINEDYLTTFQDCKLH